MCRGCKRFAHEIIQWNGYADHEREAILRRLDMLLDQVVEARVRVIDPRRLREQAEANRAGSVAFTPESRLVYEILRTTGKTLPELGVIGCRALPPWDQLSADELRADVEASFYQLSCAHYERFFPGHL